MSREIQDYLVIVDLFGGPLDGGERYRALPAPSRIEVFEEIETGRISAAAVGANPKELYRLIGHYAHTGRGRASWQPLRPRNPAEST